jgi:hypothetical protein
MHVFFFCEPRHVTICTVMLDTVSSQPDDTVDSISRDDHLGLPYRMDRDVSQVHAALATVR